MLHQFTLQVPYADVQPMIEKLNEVDIFNIYYESPIELTPYEYGYAYREREEEPIDLNIYAEEDPALSLPEAYFSLLEQVLGIDRSKIRYELLQMEDWQEPFEDIDLGNGWVIGLPDSIFAGHENYRRILFDPQGAFGTGLHGTTQDCLRMILARDFTGMRVADLGAGSGILGLAAALKGASDVLAVDLEPVEREILYNASLNQLEQIHVLQMDLLNAKSSLPSDVDWIFINIGGEETQGILDRHDFLEQFTGNYLLSGLVEWSFDQVIDPLLARNYVVEEKRQSNEWVTVILKRNMPSEYK